jgi:hypothetical protein
MTRQPLAPHCDTCLCQPILLKETRMPEPRRHLRHDVDDALDDDPADWITLPLGEQPDSDFDDLDEVA